MSLQRVAVRKFLSPVAQRIVGTPLESPGYRLWHALSHRKRSLENIEYDRLTVAVMQRVLRRNSSGIDVGAHRGVMLRHLVDLAPYGRHIAVEPLPAFAAGLRRRFPTVEVHELALSEMAGQSTFNHVVTNPSYSGLSTRKYPNGGELIDQILVQTRRLDDVISNDRAIDFMKIDVEGGEFGVIAGGQAFLAAQRPVIVFEHGWGGGARSPNGTTRPLWHALTSAGLAIYELPTWLGGGPALTQVDFEILLANGAYYFLAAGSGHGG